MHLTNAVHQHVISRVAAGAGQALAIHFDRLIQSGAVANYAELVRLGNVTRARMTQIMNLLNLALEIQDEAQSIRSSTLSRQT